MKDEREYVLELGAALGHDATLIYTCASATSWDMTWQTLLRFTAEDHHYAHKSSRLADA